MPSKVPGLSISSDYSVHPILNLSAGRKASFLRREGCSNTHFQRGCFCTVDKSLGTALDPLGSSPSSSLMLTVLPPGGKTLTHVRQSVSIIMAFSFAFENLLLMSKWSLSNCKVNAFSPSSSVPMNVGNRNLPVALLSTWKLWSHQLNILTS